MTLSVSLCAQGCCIWSGTDGDPGRTRTCYLQIRNLSLYPDELRDHTLYMPEFTADFQTSYPARRQRAQGR